MLIGFLLTVIILPFIFLFLVEPMYVKFDPLMFLLLFVLVCPIIAKLAAQLVSDVSVGFRPSRTMLVKQTAVESLVYYLIMVLLALFVILLFFGGF